MVAVDPLASLEIQDIFVTIGGVEYLMEGRPAADWLTQIVTGDLISILPGWLDEKAEYAILDKLADGSVTPTELDDATLEALSVAAGRPWWWAVTLIGHATGDIHHWSRINGHLMLAGVDARDIPLAAWVDAVYAAYTERIQDNDEYVKFKGQIDTPPTADLLDEEEEAEAFLSMLG